ncbi:MAG: hypothetical protein WDA00_01780 [Eubacteriales bacterium]
MKHPRRTLALLLALSCLCLSLVACGTLSGTYHAGDPHRAALSYTFEGRQVSAHIQVLGVSTTLQGRYQADRDTITFVFEGDNPAAAEYSGTFPFTKGKHSLTINRVTYEKR